MDCGSNGHEIMPVLMTESAQPVPRGAGCGCAQGTAAVQPSMIFGIQGPDGQISRPFAVYTRDIPTVQINFQWLAHEWPEGREAFLDTLAEAPTSMDARMISNFGFNKRPTVLLTRLRTEPAQVQFAMAVERLVRPG